MFCLVFFTTSKSKLPGYVLPAVPAIAFLGARAIAGVTWFSRRVAGYSLIGGSVFYFVTTIYFRFGFPRVHSYPNTSWELAVLLILVFGMYALATFFAGYSLSFNSDSPPNFAFRTTSVLMLVLLIELVPFEFAKTQLDVLSGKWLANILKPGDVEVDRLRTFGLRRDDHYALNFYLHRSVPAWTDDPLRDGYVLARSANCTTLKSHDQCSETWGSRNIPSGWALLRITPNHSLERPGGGRQPRQEE
jgi:hypothetical protein